MKKKQTSQTKVALAVVRYLQHVDLIGNFSAHPVAKLLWVVGNVAFCVGAYTLDPTIWYIGWTPPLTLVVAFGLSMGIVYPRIILIQVHWAARRAASKSSSRPIIHRAPGGWLVTTLRFLFTKRAFDHIFSQVLNDGREEYWEALGNGDKWLARWRRVQLYLSLGIAIVSWVGVSALKNFIKMWKAG